MSVVSEGLWGRKALATKARGYQSSMAVMKLRLSRVYSG